VVCAVETSLELAAGGRRGELEAALEGVTVGRDEFRGEFER